MNESKFLKKVNQIVGWWNVKVKGTALSTEEIEEMVSRNNEIIMRKKENEILMRNEENEILIRAITNGDIELIKSILNKMPKIEINYARRWLYDWDSPLSVAAKSGDMEIVNYLLANGANPRYRDDMAIYVALKHDKNEILKCLMEFSKEPYLEIDIKRFINKALDSKNMEAVEYLMELL